MERPDDWLFDTLHRMEESENRHSNEVRAQIASVLRKLEDHITDDIKVQSELKGDVRSLLESRTNREKTETRRQTWVIVFASSASALLMKVMDWWFAK